MFEHLLIALLRNSKGRLFLAAVLTVFGGVALYIGSTKTHKVAQLRQSRSFITAKLLDVKSFDVRKPPSRVEIQYRFDPTDADLHSLRGKEIVELAEPWAEIP